MRFNLAFALTLVVAATAGSLRLRLRCGNDCNCLNNQGARDDTITVRCCTTGELSDGVCPGPRICLSTAFVIARD